MIFNFKQRPVELFEKKIEFKVLNAGKKKTIGVFSVSITTILTHVLLNFCRLTLELFI